MIQNSINVCDCEVIHQDVIDHVKKEMIKEKVILDVSDFFKVLGDPTRSKIMCALDKNEMCVCDLAVLLNMTKSAISHQLKVLRESNLIDFRKEGKLVYYFLADGHVKDVFETAIEHVTE